MRTCLLFLWTGLLLAQPPAVEELIRQLADDDFEVREKAGRLLEERGESAREALQKAVKNSTDAEVRKRAEDILLSLDRKAAARQLEQRFAALKKLTLPAFDPVAVKPLVEKRGAFTEKEIWTADKTYLVNGNLTVARGAELTIQPGTVVLIADRCDLRVQSGARLIAEGAADKPIIFTSEGEAKNQPGYGGRLILQGGGIQLSNAQIRRSSGLRLETQAPASITQVGIFQTRGDALTVTGGMRLLDAITVREASGAGVVFEGCYPTAGALTVSRSESGFLFKGGAYPTLREAAVAEVKTDAVRVTDGSYPRIDRVMTLESDVGLRVMQGAYPRIKELLIGGTRGDGILLQDGSYPTLTRVEVNEAAGFGLNVTDGSYPQIGSFLGRNCKKGDQQIEPGSRIRPLGDPGE